MSRIPRAGAQAAARTAEAGLERWNGTGVAPRRALALAEDLRVLAELGLIEMTVDELGEVRCAPTELGDEMPTASKVTSKEREE